MLSATLKAKFKHIGMYVCDLDKMVDFYPRWFGLVVTGGGMGSSGRGAFLSSDPTEHHQIALVVGREPGSKPIPATAGDAWMGMWTSAKTPKADIERMQSALRKILATPEFKEPVQTKVTMAPMFRSAADMDRLQRTELEMWLPIIKASGFTPDQ